ncbi:MAG: TolC family protein [Firmicutes bacterium]|nr:TolC family protein [Bacillota bacterium]NPV30627.1 TolC family protein [Bacillota bacterium]
MRQIIALLLAILFAFGGAVPGAWAKEPARPEISLNEAIAKALAQSERVKKAEKEVDRTEALRDYAADQLDYTPVMPAGNPMIEAAWAELLAADLTWQSSKKNLTAEQDAVALDACKKYWDVLQAQEKVKAAEAALASARRQLQNARAGYQAGTLPLAALIGAEAQYRRAEAALVSARNDLDKAYTALNQAIGLWPEDRPVLTTSLEFHPLEVSSLDYEVTKVLENCPQVWLAEQGVRLKQYYQDIMFYKGIVYGTFSYKPYEARKVEVEQAELDAASTKKLFDLITRQLYYSVKSLEEAYAGAQEGVRAAEEALRVARLKLDVGMATAADVAAAEQALADAKKAAFELACQHAYMKLAFGKPWAYLSSLSSSSSAGTGAAG